jgi:hypothetical protein
VAGISFAYDIQIVTVATPPNPNAADLEALWRDPAMQHSASAPTLPA